MTDIFGNQIKIKDLITIWDSYMSCQTIALVVKVTDRSVLLYIPSKLFYMGGTTIVRTIPADYAMMCRASRRCISSHHMVILEPNQKTDFLNSDIRYKTIDHKMGQFLNDLNNIIDSKDE